MNKYVSKVTELINSYTENWLKGIIFLLLIGAVALVTITVGSAATMLFTLLSGIEGDKFWFIICTLAASRAFVGGSLTKLKAFVAKI